MRKVKTQRSEIDETNTLAAQAGIDGGRLWDGTKLKDELTLGVHWDFGY